MIEYNDKSIDTAFLNSIENNDAVFAAESAGLRAVMVLGRISAT